VDEILAEAVESRAELLKHMNALSAEDLAKNIKFAGDARRPPAEYPLGAYLKGWCKHDPMHALDMSRALPEMDSPELQQWFADPVVQGYQAMMNREAAV
jgi:hypothetical protein